MATRTTRSAPGQAARRRVMGQLRSLVALLQTSARAVEANTGVTNAQLFLLRRLADGDSHPVGDLARRMHARQNALSPVIRRLVEAGLIRRRPAADDARRALLSITSRGSRLLQHASPPPAERLLHALDGLSPSQVRGLSGGLGALLTTLESPPSDDRLLFEDQER